MDDLGWLLSEATHWRDGLPRMVNTLAKAGAGGTGVIDAEIDILQGLSRYFALPAVRSCIRTSTAGCYSIACCWPPPKVSPPGTW